MRISLGLLPAMGMVELGLRAFWPDVSPYYQPRKGKYVVDPDIGYRIRPHASWVEKSWEYGIHAKADEAGFADRMCHPV